MSAPPPPAEPAAPPGSDGSMPTRRFGRETVNYYAGSPLNRYAFLRADAAFLSRAAAAPAARFVLLSGLDPLVADRRRLALLSPDDVRPLIGDDPFGAEARPGEAPLVVFLGLAEGSADDAGGAVDIDTSGHGVVRGQPYFAVDATPRGPGAAAATAFLERQFSRGLSLLTDARSMTLAPEAASMFAQARSIVDWNTRNPFCAGCGRPTRSVHAGYKRVCRPPAPGAGPDAQPERDCPTRHGVSNLSFPRSDPTMIAAVVSADGKRILLGRQARYPPRWYSTLAGFLEPGESVEEAVRREVWEEAGVEVGRVVLHSTQPWPYPSSLMLGAVAQALPGEEDIVLNDRELESARWFTLDEVREALAESVSRGAPMSEGHGEGSLRLPPPQAIANRLMTAVVEGFLTDVPKI